MRRILLLSMTLCVAPPVLAQASAPPQLKCEAGPATKTFGNGPWLAYACDDGQSVVVVTGQGNPAFPFVFSFTPKGGSMSLFGEGTGNKQATALAYSHLERLTASDIAALAKEARSAMQDAAGNPKSKK